VRCKVQKERSGRHRPGEGRGDLDSLQTLEQSTPGVFGMPEHTAMVAWQLLV